MNPISLIPARRTVLCWLFTASLCSTATSAQQLAQGPFNRMVIRGVTVIDGTAAPPSGPMDIVVENGRITEVRLVGDDFGRIDESARPARGDFELDAHGMYLMPGFIDAHVHIGRTETTGLPVSYIYNLWLGNGVTTVLEAGSGRGLEWTIAQRDSSANHQIIAPRIFAYVRPGMSFDRPVTTPETAREWVRSVSQQGADGLKLGSHPPKIMEALIDEAHLHGLKTTAHLGQTGVTRMNVVDAARLGLDHQQHWYGLAESMLVGRSIPDWRFDHNNNNEEIRFADAGRFWSQAAEPGSEQWNAVMEELLELDLTIIPTMAVYERNRDLSRVKYSEWHREYASPMLRESWNPDPGNHGSRYYHWTTEYETDWYHMFYKWQRFLDEYKDRGGRVATGADEGNAFHLYGFGYLREFELLQQAGFHPLEVIRSATMHAAEALGVEDDLGTIEPGKIADFVLVEENPLENFKVLYGTGAEKFDPDTGELLRVGGVRYTVKDGIVYDAKRLLAEVRQMVREASSAAGVSEQH